MYKVKLEDKEYFLPANWNEVTFDKLLKLKLVNFESSAGNILTTSMALGVLMECDYKIIMKLDADDFIKLANAVKWVYKFDVQPEFKNEFEIDGVKYKLVPNFNKLTMGEMASIEQMIMEDAEKNLDKILAILIREVDENGNITEFKAETLDARADVFRHKLTLPQVHGISSFFLDGRNKHTPDIADYSNQNPGKVTIQNLDQMTQQ